MLLVIDVGNTQTVVGLYGTDDALQHHWRISTVSDRTADEHALLVTQLLGLEGLERRAITGIAVCSTVPHLTAVLREMTERWPEAKAVVVEPGVKTGLPILYENPREVGADRIANAVAAWDMYGGPSIVVDFSGTATIIDAITGKGEYLGGAIIPGVEISLDALFERAAALRQVELVEPRSAIGRNIIESVQSGAVYGFAAQVDGLCRRFMAELGPATVISTGSLSGLIAPLSESIEYQEPWLTLYGLRLIYQRNT